MKQKSLGKQDNLNEKSASTGFPHLGHIWAEAALSRPLPNRNPLLGRVSGERLASVDLLLRGGTHPLSSPPARSPFLLLSLPPPLPPPLPLEWDADFASRSLYEYDPQREAALSQAQNYVIIVIKELKKEPGRGDTGGIAAWLWLMCSY